MTKIEEFVIQKVEGYEWKENGRRWNWQIT